MSTKLPVLFVGHGSPMNAIETNPWSEGFTALGKSLPKPRAILAVSAHWMLDGAWLTGNPKPPTIHDFGGFPQALYAVEYPAPGAPDLASQVARMLDRPEALRSDWGLDHGTWSVLKWMFPEADIPVVQLSLDRRRSLHAHLELGERLQDLREQGVLIVGSGNVVHNLRDAIGRMRTGNRTTPDWAARFDTDVEKSLIQRDHAALAGLASTDDGRRAHPTVEHWLPMLVAAGAAGAAQDVRFSNDAFDWGSIGMRSVVFEG